MNFSIKLMTLIQVAWNFAPARQGMNMASIHSIFKETGAKTITADWNEQYDYDDANEGTEEVEVQARIYHTVNSTEDHLGNVMLAMLQTRQTINLLSQGHICDAREWYHLAFEQTAYPIFKLIPEIKTQVKYRLLFYSDYK